MYKFWDAFSLCFLYDVFPTVKKHVTLQSQSLCKNMACVPWGASKMHPLSLGAQTEKIHIFGYIYTLLLMLLHYKEVQYKHIKQITNQIVYFPPAAAV